MADYNYGVLQPVVTADEIRSTETVTIALRLLKEVGTNLTIQPFPMELTPEDWQKYLDIAESEGVSIIGKIAPIDWNPDPEDLTPILDILDVVGDHPALYGFQYLHEPLEVFTIAEIQQMYSTIKAAHPNVRLVAFWSGEIREDADFAEGLCDICVVNLKPFQEDPGTSLEDGLDRIALAAPVVARQAPNTELWSTAQVWAPAGGGQRGFRVPAPEEMETLYVDLRDNYPLGGFMWEVWAFEGEPDTLSSEALADQRGMVRSIYDRTIARLEDRIAEQEEQIATEQDELAAQQDLIEALEEQVTAQSDQWGETW
jgi:uncharacterized coiled-coil protein SlyX